MGPEIGDNSLRPAAPPPKGAGGFPLTGAAKCPSGEPAEEAGPEEGAEHLGVSLDAGDVQGHVPALSRPSSDHLRYVADDSGRESSALKPQAG